MITLRGGVGSNDRPRRTAQRRGLSYIAFVANASIEKKKDLEQPAWAARRFLRQLPHPVIKPKGRARNRPMITQRRKVLCRTAVCAESNSPCPGVSHIKSRMTRKAGIGLVLVGVGAYCMLLSAPLPAQIDESMLPSWAQQTWAPGIPGGIPADNDAIRPATVWVPNGNPYNGYSVNPSLAG